MLFVVRILRDKVATSNDLLGLLFAENLLRRSQETTQGYFAELLLFQEFGKVES